jgi:3-oxoacyl-[acyl-carrier protein] reductase
MDTQRLDGKRALVCGASRGIGAAAARELAARGATLGLLARDGTRLAEVRNSLAGTGHVDLEADMTDLAGLRAAVGGWAGREPVHVLVNNSGGPPPGPLFGAEPDALLHAFRQHVLAAQTLVQLVVPGMTDVGYGRIVNVISTSVKQPIPGLGVSNTIRGAMASWAKTLATELGPLGITVNNVLPGATATERLDALIVNKAQKEGSTQVEAIASLKAPIPAGRFGEPEEIAAAIGWLASPAAAYVNGINLPVDGGRLGTL